MANYFKSIEAVGGRLEFDKTGMTFRSHGINFQLVELRIDYGNVRRAEKKGLFNGMTVYTKDGDEHTFVVWGRKHLIEYLNSKAV